MAKKIINNGDSGLTVRTSLNDNFTELYLEKTAPTHTHTASNVTVVANGNLIGPTNQSALENLDTRSTASDVAIAANAADIVLLEAEDVSLDGRITTLEESHTLLLVATSTALTQEPGTTDTPLQVEFGALQSTTDIDLSVLGALTFKTAGKYIISPFFQYGRDTATGTSILFNRYLVNGVQIGNSLSAKVDNANTLVPWSSSIQFTANVNDVLTIELARDAAGADSGGLFSSATTGTLGWNVAPSASIQIYKAT